MSKYCEGKVNDSRTVRCVVLLTEAEHSAIQTYRHTNRIGTKSEALRHLVRLSLNSEMPAQTGE